MPAPAGTARNWSAYRARFVEPRRIEAGLRFWQSHEQALPRAQAQWGVPAELIVHDTHRGAPHTPATDGRDPHTLDARTPVASS